MNLPIFIITAEKVQFFVQHIQYIDEHVTRNVSSLTHSIAYYLNNLTIFVVAST